VPVRDAVDARIIADVRQRTGKIIDSQKEVGGWPDYRSAAPPPDADNDGVPDTWETAHGMSQRDAATPTPWTSPPATPNWNCT